MKPITKIKKDLSVLEELLNDFNVLIDNGSKFYLGDPIFRTRRILQHEVFKLKEKIKDSELKS